jgi:glucose-6-phosphate 1-dehydrogenase
MLSQASPPKPDADDVCSAAPAEGESAPPGIITIFGASGDLTRRKLIPALYNLFRGGLLSSRFAVIGLARRPFDSDSFRRQIHEQMGDVHCQVSHELWERFAPHLYYLPGDLGDPATYLRLEKLVGQAALEHEAEGSLLHYLAVSPDHFGEIVGRLHEAGLLTGQGNRGRRVVFEKPFGADLDSARALNADISRVLQERQIYRIDHYLGKATVQNILALRFANGIFEPVWDRRYIDHIQITAAETVGVENRADYYESAGALRDMVPNHLFQLLSLTAMEPPISFEADAVRDEQAKVLRAVQPLTPEEVLTRTARGQYGTGTLEGKAGEAYRSEPGVAADSRTETFAALRFMIDNWRWAGVPFYLRTGKRLARRVTEIAIQFRKPPFVLFRETPVDRLQPNQLVLNIQPDEGISLSFQARVPGSLMKLGPVDMTFKYADYFGQTAATGYERLIYDGLCGDATLFQRIDMVEASWKAIQTVQDVWRTLHPRAFPNYNAGSWGPREADELIEHDGRQWRKIG